MPAESSTTIDAGSASSAVAVRGREAAWKDAQIDVVADDDARVLADVGRTVRAVAAQPRAEVLRDGDDGPDLRHDPEESCRIGIERASRDARAQHAS